MEPLSFDRELLTDDENAAIQGSIGIMGCWASDPDDEASVHEVAGREVRSIISRFPALEPYRCEVENILIDSITPQHFPCA